MKHTAQKPSRRSITPPCPGMRWLESLTLQWRFSADSPRSPIWLATEATMERMVMPKRLKGRLSPYLFHHPGHQKPSQGRGNDAADETGPGLLRADRRTKLRAAEGTAREIRGDIRCPHNREHPQQGQDAEFEMVAHDRRNEDDQRRIEEARCGPDLVGHAARHERARHQEGKPRRDEQADPCIHQEENGQKGEAKGKDTLHQLARFRSRHPRPFDHDGDPGRQPEQGEGPAAPIGGQEGDGDHDEG